jgi:diguanylate cyclase (GGDEF)-like protein
VSPFPTLRRALAGLLPRALWPRLALLMVLATGPMLAMLVLSAVDDGRRVVDAARDQVVQLARLAAEQQDDSLQEASHLLRVLAKVPAVRGMQVGCEELLRDVVADHPRIEAIAMIRPDGIVGCGSRPGAAGLDAGDRPYFQEAMVSDGNRAVLSNLMVSWASGRPTMFVAAPVRVGVLRAGVLIASLNLQWFARLGDRLPVGSTRSVQVLDSRDGAVLARAQDLTVQAGETVPDHPVLQAYRASPSGGSVVADDVDGVSRIFGFAPLPGRDGIVIAVGLMEAEVRAAANTRSGAMLLAAVGAAGFAFAVAWMAADRALLRPIRSLAVATHQVGCGDMSAHARMGRGAARELRQLGASFARMARRLREREGRITAMQGQLEEMNRQLRILVRQDGLTGLGNRRHFDDTLGTEYRRAMRMGTPLTLIMVDVDRFKAFNDLYGHPAGDACLQAVAKALAASLRRPADLAARYGGEEFAVLLPSTDEAGALVSAARIQDAMRAAALPHAGSEGGFVSLSLGVAVLMPSGGGDGPATLVEAADTALYAAKRAGRDQVQVAGQTAPAG